MIKYSIIACFIGYILDLIIGDPYWIYHPIRLVGNLISLCEKLFRKITNSFKGLYIAGIFLVIIVCGISTGIVFVLNNFAYKTNLYLGLAVDSIFCYFILATKSLKTESMKVYDKLAEKDLEGSRKAVSMIVGRDTQNLSEAGVIKATVETVAENLSDGVIAPLFYLMIGGSTLGTLYKAINTMDSMVGYKNDKYLYFGRTAAKLDDVVNFIPARLSALLLILGSLLYGKDAKNAFHIFVRDRYNHSSPNSAQTEAVCAGALHIQLAGDAYYFGKLVKKPFIGDYDRDVNIEDIKHINNMMYIASVCAVLIFGVIRILIQMFCI